jgi:NADH dehydrogenase (ubiquinone) flavoprotein 2
MNNKKDCEFEFNPENQEKILQILKKYPDERSKSAILPLLDLAQRQNNGWLSDSCLMAVGKTLNLPKIYVREVASFYSMFFLEPVGKYVIEVCSTLSCMLCGSKKIIKILENHLGISMLETTKDGLFALKKIECLGSCVSAPVVKIGDDYFEDLDEKSIIKIIEELRADQKPRFGSQKGRISSEAIIL